MTYIIMHKTNAHWESGAVPTQELIVRVGRMIGDLARAGVLLSGEGLRSSAEGVRLTFAGGARTVTPGPLQGEHELPAAFSILRVPSIDDAIEWTTRYASALGNAEFDIRPVTEPWDIGVGEKPADLATRRYMAVRKATAASEADAEPSPQQRRELDRLIDETTRTGVHLATVALRSSRRGRRLRTQKGGTQVTDGPFAESKEMIGGYVIITASSLDEATRRAEEYLAVVDADEVDVREVAAIVSAGSESVATAT